MNKKRKVSNASLILGIGCIIVPILYSFGNSFFILILKKPMLPIPLGMYILKVGYLVFITSSLMLGILGLTLKPRLWNKDVTKIIIGLICTIFSLFYFGRIIFFN